MRLTQWMRANRYRDATFIKEINEILKERGQEEYGWRAVATWRAGVCVPRPPVVAAIAELTKGEVTYQDHVDNCNDAGFRRTKHTTPAT